MHIFKANLARETYMEDRKKQVKDDEEYFAADLEKIIVFTQITLEWNHQYLFTRRIIIFSEMFAPLGHGRRYGIIWHEAIRGRNDEDLCS